MTPSNFNEPYYGSSPTGHRGSTAGRGVRFDGPAESPQNSSAIIDDDHDHHLAAPSNRGRQRRRSSVTARFVGSLAHAGGVNSIENFAKSWTRAAGFLEAAPHRPSMVLPEDEEHRVRHEIAEFGRRDGAYHGAPRASALRAHIEAESPPDETKETTQAVQDGADRNASTERLLPQSRTRGGGGHRSTISGGAGRRGSFNYLASEIAGLPASMRRSSSLAPNAYVPLSGSHGTSYGTVNSNGSKPSMTEANDMWKEQQKTLVVDGEHEPLIVKEVEQDGHMILVVEGQSTLPQTVFNSLNCLIGVGLLSLPLGMKYVGWAFGLGFIAISAWVCGYTARLLAICMDVDPSLITYADLAFISYGNRARVATSILFTIELLAANVALIVLFADTLSLLVPTFSVVEYKFIAGLILIPLNFAPLRILSFTSVLGIICSLLIVGIIILDGFVKFEAPGSLWAPRPPFLFPATWLTVPLSFGLLMSPWGGAAVFPNIYRDMRHPYKYDKAVNITFIFTGVLDAVVAAIGILMFGDEIRTEVTASILATKGYIGSLTILMSVFIAVIPLTKIPLNARPILSTVEVFCGLDAQSLALSAESSGTSSSGTFMRGLAKLLIRVVVIIVFVLIAIIFPAFDSVVAFMGSGLCFAICVILPIFFYLKLFGSEISRKERIIDWVIIVVSTIMAISGTIWAFLPKSLIGAEVVGEALR